jgi:hypothetical protein
MPDIPHENITYRIIGAAMRMATRPIRYVRYIRYKIRCQSRP